MGMKVFFEIKLNFKFYYKYQQAARRHAQFKDKGFDFSELFPVRDFAEQHRHGYIAGTNLF